MNRYKGLTLFYRLATFVSLSYIFITTRGIEFNILPLYVVVTQSVIFALASSMLIDKFIHKGRYDKISTFYIVTILPLMVGIMVWLLIWLPTKIWLIPYITHDIKIDPHLLIAYALAEAIFPLIVLARWYNSLSIPH
jgi:hypothetical protein